MAIDGTSDTTDAAGAFTIANVAPPNDATASSASGNWAHVYRGLSTATPMPFPIAALGGSVTVASSATVTGTVTTSTTVTTPTTVDYSISAGWVSTANVAVRVHALQFARPSSSDLPSRYYGYAKTTGSTTLVPGSTYPSIDLTLLGAIASSTLSGTVSGGVQLHHGHDPHRDSPVEAGSHRRGEP